MKFSKNKEDTSFGVFNLIYLFCILLDNQQVMQKTAYKKQFDN